MEIQYIIYIFLSSKFLLECAIAITHLRHQTNLAIPLIIYILFSITDWYNSKLLHYDFGLNWHLSYFPSATIHVFVKIPYINIWYQMVSVDFSLT